MLNKLKTLSKEGYRVARECEAPICIVDVWLYSYFARNGGVNRSYEQIWYPDETICTCYRKKPIQKLLNLKEGSAPKWIRRQRNIKRHWQQKGKQPNFYFTYEMLNANRIVRGSTKGLNPDTDKAIQLARYFKNDR